MYGFVTHVLIEKIIFYTIKMSNLKKNIAEYIATNWLLPK